jgi:hypothetical protein
MSISVSNSSAVSSVVSQASTQDQKSLLVLKKALNAQAQTAAALIDALPQPPSSNNLPQNLGQTINTKA